MNKITIFLSIWFTLWLLISCNNTTYYSQPADNGLLIAIECTSPKTPPMLITENDIDSVDWEQQKYYLKNDTVSGKDTRELSLRLCTWACQISFYLDKQPLFAIPVEADYSHKNLPIEGQYWLYCPCDHSSYDCIIQNDTMSLLQHYSNYPIPMFEDKRIKDRLATIGKLR